MSDITLCNNNTCPLRLRCRRATDLVARYQKSAHFKPKRANGQWVCDQYWFNGNTEKL